MKQESFTDDGWYVAGTGGKPILLLLLVDHPDEVARRIILTHS